MQKIKIAQSDKENLKEYAAGLCTSRMKSNSSHFLASKTTAGTSRYLKPILTQRSQMNVKIKVINQGIAGKPATQETTPAQHTR